MKSKKFLKLHKSDHKESVAHKLLRYYMRSILPIVGLLAAPLLFWGCATQPDIDVDELVKQMAANRPVEKVDESAGPDKPASKLPPPPKESPVAKAGEVTIQPDCVLQVSVREDSALDGSYSVNDISAIQLGYVGPVFLRNMTEEQAAKKIKDVLENRFFNKATVSVRILGPSYDKVAVYGQVASGGVIKIGSGDRISLNDALLRAGNFTAAIKGVRVRIVRGGLLRAVSGSEDGEIFDLLDEDNNPKVPDVFLWNNDVAYIFTSTGPSDEPSAVVDGDKDVLVLGEVNRQGIYRFKGGEPCSMLYLILKMGGFPTYANKEEIKLIRPDGEGGEKEIIVDATRVLREGNPDDDVKLENGDRIIVPARKISWF
jgi:protein involved in polysaccharide export with SLBB domain